MKQRARRLSTPVNFVWMASGNAIYSACSLVMVAVIAKLGLPGDVGMYSLGIAVSQPVIFLSQLNLTSILAADVTGRYRVGTYFSLRLWMSILAMLGVLVYTSIAIHDRVTQAVVLVTMAGALFDSLSEVEYGLFRVRERMNLVSISLIVRGVLSLAGLLAAMLIWHNIIAAVVASALASVVTTCFLDTFMLKGIAEGEVSPFFWNWGASVHFADQMKLAKIALPMGLVMMLASLTINIPRYLVDGSLGHVQLGIFSAMASFATIGRIVVLAMGQSTTPNLARAFARDPRHDFAKKTAILMGLCALVGVLGVAIVAAAGPLLLKTAFTKEYAERNTLFLAVIAASALGYLGNMVGIALTAARVFKMQLPHLLSIVLVTAVAGFVLIPRMGLMGAAWAIGIASMWQFMSGAALLAWRIRRPTQAEW